MIYCVDTSALIFLDRENSYDVFPILWDNYLTNLVLEGRFIASEEVKVELKGQDDFLYNWLKTNCGNMYLPTTTEIMETVTRILADYPNLMNPMKPSQNHADPFVIALAIEAPTICAGICQDTTTSVVTYEKATGNTNGPRIPDVCRACNIRVIKLIDIFKTEGWRLTSLKKINMALRLSVNFT